MALHACNLWRFNKWNGRDGMYGSRIANLVHIDPLTETLNLVATGWNGNLVRSLYLEWILERMHPHLRATPHHGRGGIGDGEGVRKSIKMG